jgi:hypothetical protein
MQASKARLHLQSATTVGSYSFFFLSFSSNSLLAQFHEKAIEFHYEIKDLYVQNPFVHEVDETI